MNLLFCPVSNVESTRARAGRGSSIGFASARCADGRGFDPHVRQNILSLRFGHEKFSTIISLPSADSRRAIASYWRNNGHLVLVNWIGGLPRNSVARLTDRARNDLKCVEGP